ncbi:GTPase HflX [Alloiococcus sp. CFN-8]|uniref:GTPase HflX n=1 Tax=Alloiococcus sp. CFN-8 TaxID=3416081 RepID=UPI003CE721B2
MIQGNIDGIRNTYLEALEDLYSIKVPKYSLCTNETLEVIAEITEKINREISVVIDRKGKVLSVVVGDSSTVEIPIINIKERKLSGIRIVHTHPNGNSRLSAIDTSALMKLKLDCIAAVGVEEGGVKDISIGFCSVNEDILTTESINNITIDEALEIDIEDKIKEAESLIKETNVIEETKERAIIVGSDTEESLEELAELARACDLPVVHSVFQNRSKIDSAYYIGTGKVEEIALLRQAYNANVVVFDDELTGSQVRNLEEAIGVKIIDRTTLILEIFANRAKSRESRIQVELAQLKYRLTRLSGLGTVLSRTGGGIGTRGPGEKKLETDRRHIRERIYDLSRELEKIKKVREVQREKRNKQNIPKVSLVGYTNTGKSTLRNALVEMSAIKEAQGKEGVFEANMLFATLDITTRAIKLPDNRVVTLTDTVGFVRKLPHELVEAFKSTLEEVIYSDILIHVIDASSLEVLNQIYAVENVLFELGANNKPTILALNKIDKVNDESLNILKSELNGRELIEISAKERINLIKLLNMVSEYLPQKLKIAKFLIPYTEQSVASHIYRTSRVISEDYREDGTVIEAEVEDEIYNRYSEFII